MYDMNRRLITQILPSQISRITGEGCRLPGGDETGEGRQFRTPRRLGAGGSGGTFWPVEKIVLHPE